MKYETKLTLCKIAFLAVLISAYVFTALSLRTNAGEGYDGLVRRAMYRGHLTETEADSALAMPREVYIDEENHCIYPGTFIHIHDDGQSGYTFTITDTIWGVKVYPIEENAPR